MLRLQVTRFQQSVQAWRKHKTAGDLATVGRLEPATRQAFTRALRFQGADDAALDALSSSSAGREVIPLVSKSP
jgi:hypothetical protein